MSLDTVSTSSTFEATTKWVTIPFGGSWHSKVEGSAIDSDGNVFACGQSCDADDDASICNGMLGKFGSLDGSVIWTKKFSEFDRIFKLTNG